MPSWGNLRRNSNALENEAISVLIPAYKASKTIGLAVNSSLAALPANGRVIVFVDGECKDTERVLSQVGDARLRWFVSKDNVGAREARQRLLDLAETELVATLDADDVCLPWRFAMQRRALKKRSAELVFSNSIRFGRALGFPWIKPELPVALNQSQIRYALSFTNPLVNSSMLAYRRTLNELGGYQNEIEDLGLWLEAARQNRKVYRTAFWAVLYRVHPSQLSRTKLWNQNLQNDSSLKTLKRTINSEFFQHLNVDQTETLLQELRRRFLCSNVILFFVSMGFKASIRHCIRREFRDSNGRYKLIPVTQQLMGGLGNQLFGYMAGLSLASKKATYLNVDDGFGTKNFNHHGSTIRSLKLPIIFSDLIGDNGVRAWISGALVRLNLGATLPGLWVSRVIGMYSSNVVGYDENLFKFSGGMRIRGYFQSFRYADALKDSGEFPNFALVAPSRWFEKMSEAMKRSDPIVVHVRRGDYASEENKATGQLSSDYFTKSLALLDPTSSKTAWIFSDAPTEVAQEFASKTSRDINIIDQDGIDAAEVLMLMAQAQDIVISNSTFSWWAAYLGSKKNVVAPSKWFKGMDDPDDLIPPSWLRVESTWL